MAGEFQLSAEIGLSLSLVLYSFDKTQAWDTTALSGTGQLVAYNAADRATKYYITVNDPLSRGLYGASAPAALPAGRYHFEFVVTSTDDKVGAGILDWDGAAEITLTSLNDKIDVVGGIVDSSQTTLNTVDTNVATITSTTSTINGKLPASLVSGRMDVSVGAYQSGLGPLLASNVPTNFSSLGINGSGHVSRVTTVDALTGTVALSSAGLDNIAVTAPSGAPATFREYLVMTFRALFRKRVKNENTGKIEYYNDAGDTVLVEADFTSSSGVETIDTASVP